MVEGKEVEAELESCGGASCHGALSRPVLAVDALITLFNPYVVCRSHCVSQLDCCSFIYINNVITIIINTVIIGITLIHIIINTIVCTAFIIATIIIVVVFLTLIIGRTLVTTTPPPLADHLLQLTRPCHQLLATVANV